MEVIETQWIPLPDGTRLAARIFLPDPGQRPCGAVLEYLPYRRRDVTAARDEGTYPAYARAGIAGVRVDIRGTGDSEGAFDDEYSETELADAEAVISWIATQNWSNGRVGMMGISWGGFNALQLAARRPTALKAVISVASTVDRFADDIHYKGGAMLGANLYWACQMLGRAALPPDADVVGEAWREKWLERLDQTPSLAAKWHREQTRSSYWQHGSVCEDFSAIAIPCLVMAGWADGYRNTPWKARAGMGDRVRALTGPWVHHYPHYGEPGPRADFHAESIAWWQEHLNDGPATNLPAHRLWLSEGLCPGPRNTEPGRWIAISQTAPTWRCLHLQKGATSHDLCFSNTSFDKSPPASGPREANPPALVLNTALACGLQGGEFFTQSGADLPGDQHADDARALCFDTTPLDAPLDIIGMSELSLTLSADAPHGTLIARLCDVHPDGRSHRISLGVLNLCHRDSAEQPAPMIPHKDTHVTLQLDATAYRLPQGHRLRLALSTRYSPYVLPTPMQTTLRFDPANAQLHLPSHRFEPVTLPEGTDTRPSYPQTRTARMSRTTTHDPRSGEIAVSVTALSPQKTHPGHGMVWTDDRVSHWQLTEGDPLSLTVEESCTGIRWRNGIKTEIRASARMTASASHWHITTRLQAFEQDAAVFDRQWRDDVVREFG